MHRSVPADSLDALGALIAQARAAILCADRGRANGFFPAASPILALSTCT